MNFQRKPLALAVSALVVTGTLLSGCGGSSSGGGGGNYTMNLAGGNAGIGATAYGGDGGTFDLWSYGATEGIHVKKKGKAAASFSSQMNKITPFLGLNPLEIDADTTVVANHYTTTADGAGIVAGTVYVGSDGVMRTAAGATVVYATDPMVDDGTLYTWSGNAYDLFTAVGDDTTPDAAAAGQPYFYSTNDQVYISDGESATDDDDATGLSVAKDATLTFGLNDGTWADVDFDNDVVNKGTITTADASTTQRGHIYIDTDGSFLNSGTLDTSGNGTVIDGGDFEVWAEYSLINGGVINTAGADNTAGAGGDGGEIWLGSDYYTENTADLNSSGGDGSTGNNGGSAGDIDLEGYYGSMRNSGDLMAVGGDGDAGGNGGDVYLYNEDAGDVLNSGNVDTSGGHGSVTTGGDAGDFDMDAYGGLLATSGDVTAVGGNAAADNNAGDGGDVYLYAEYGYIYEYTPAGNIEVSGNYTLTGGASSGTGDGGNGGDFDVEMDDPNYDVLGEQGIYLLGYNDITTTGGSGQFPGEGGNVYLYSEYGYTYVGDIYYAGGPVSNQANIDASAGTYTGSADTGTHRADGGYVYLETAYYYVAEGMDVSVTNSGDITTNGGGGKNATSTSYLRGGGIWMWGYTGVKNSGSITSNGGDDVAADGGTDGRGGYGSWIEMYAELGPVVNSGHITANGGDGEYEGGDGSDWTGFTGPSVENSGNITGIGGDTDNTLATHYPGYGGWVWLMGVDGPASVSNSGTITLTPGADYSTVYPDSNGYYKVVGAHCSGDC
ncbi:MAG: hypothetical protein OQL05_02625 [Gammaproteobacteria bacterium]|nr:hypothetical protein [Gammaproteobacteria bacterium]MCW8972157.1 hypothetical protein [Gammaproteobacteria bacterium]MCW8992452.1 hypothetical protein [Gammaproteobacteria bacterium]